MAYGFQLEPDEKREILRIARATLSEVLKSGRIPPGKPHRRSLLAPAPTFVSLHKGADLRGCVGIQNEDTPLYRAVQEMAVAAASRDPRFSPLSIEELESISIEVSILGERLRVRETGEIEIGVHGLSVLCRGVRGLLLPQVASGTGWTAEEFLAHLCRKAGLGDGDWRSTDAVIERFTAQVFDEGDYPPLDPQEILAQLMRDPAGH